MLPFALNWALGIAEGSEKKWLYIQNGQVAI